MDDFLQSFKTKYKAIEQTTCIKETLQNEGFNLTKLFSNGSSFPFTDKAEGDKALTQQILGQMLNVKTAPSYLRNPIWTSN